MKTVFLFMLIYVVLVFLTYIVYATNAININNWVIIAGFIIFFVSLLSLFIPNRKNQYE